MSLNRTVVGASREYRYRVLGHRQHSPQGNWEIQFLKVIDRCNDYVDIAFSEELMKFSNFQECFEMNPNGFVQVLEGLINCVATASCTKLSAVRNELITFRFNDFSHKNYPDVAFTLCFCHRCRSLTDVDQASGLEALGSLRSRYPLCRTQGINAYVPKHLYFITL